MPDPNDDLLAEAASLDPPESPSKRYEDITIRLIEFDFPTGRQEFVLYPEDEIIVADERFITLVFHTMGDRFFRAHTSHILWDTYEERPHKREVGTARPDPAEIVREQAEILKKRMGERRAMQMAEEARLREADSYQD